MKKTVLSFLFAGALLAALGSAPLSARSFSEIRVDVPFDFMVGDEAHTAGSYTLAPVDTARSTLILRSSDGRARMVFMTITASSRLARRQSSLVFHRYGDQYFLSEIWTAGAVSGHQLIPASRERELSVSMDAHRPALAVVAAAQ